MFRAPVLDLYVTGACNLDCPYCFGEVDTRPGMERDTFRQALRFAQYIGAAVIELCGGEPLLYRDLEWGIERARAEGFGLILRTNGLLVGNYRSLIAESFSAVGISLDGDAEANGRLRPLKGRRHLGAEARFETPLHEVAALKALNPGLRILLASVATPENLDGLVALGAELVARATPLDLWKVHQFVDNNFRAAENSARFTLSDARFAELEHELRQTVAEAFPLSCRRAGEIDGSCLVVNRDGEVLLGARRLGNILRKPFEEIGRELEQAGAAPPISSNKSATYRTVIASEGIP